MPSANNRHRAWHHYQHHTTPHTNTIQHHTPTPHNTTHQHQHHTTPHQHHTRKLTKKSEKIRLGTTQKHKKIEENHVLWHPWAIPGHSWVLLGRPRGSKGEKVTKNVVRSPPSRDLFWSTFRSKIVFFTKKCCPGSVFCESFFFFNFVRFFVDF